jgi:hypothetical protein
MGEALALGPLIAHVQGLSRSVPQHPANGLEVTTEVNQSNLPYQNWAYRTSFQDRRQERLKDNGSTAKRSSTPKAKDYNYQHPRKQSEQYDDIPEAQTPSLHLDGEVSPTAKRSGVFGAIVKKWLIARGRYSKSSAQSHADSGGELLHKLQMGEGVIFSKPPNLSHCTLITEALLNSPKNRLSTKSVCKHIMENYKWYNDHRHDGWQVSLKFSLRKP